MSPRFSIIPGRAVTDARVSDGQLRVLAALGVYIDADGWCHPSQSTIAKQLNVSRQFINKTISQLVELGYLAKRAQHRDDGSQTVNEYRVLHDGEATPCQPATTGGATSGDDRGVQPLATTGGATSGDDSKNDPSERPILKDRTLAGSPVTEAFDLYNGLAARRGLPAAQVLNKQRRRALELRLAECGGLAGWMAALGKVESSAYLCGSRGWRAGLDFLLQPSSFLKVMEGAYDDIPAHKSAASRPQTNFDANLASLFASGRG